MSDSLLTPEAEFVLRSAKATVDDRWRSLCGQPLRWDEVLAVAADERAAQVIARALPPEAPEEARAAFRRIRLVAEFRDAQLDGLNEATLACLERSGAAAVLLKGGALVASGIATTAERPMSDIDLLLAPDEALDVWERLQHAGWRWDRERYPGHLYERQHHLPPLVDAAGSDYRLEIHRDLFPQHHPFPLTADDMRRDSTAVEFRGARIRVPNPTHLLIHTAIHFAWSHALESKAWRTFRDVELLIARTPVDWRAVVDAAKRTRATSCAYWTLRLARAAIDTSVPGNVLDSLHPARSERLLRRLERHYARNMLLTQGRCPSERLNRMLWEAGVNPQRQGHGNVRPWDRNVRIPEVVEWERARGRTGLMDRWRQTRRLAHYVWDLR